MARRIIVTLGKIDEDGFNGREPHPAASDAGAVGLVVGMSREDVGPLSRDKRDAQNWINVYNVLLADGRTVEILDHEVERMEIEHDEPISPEDATTSPLDPRD